MGRRSERTLRPRDKQAGRKIKKKAVASKSKSATYERDKKRVQRARKAPKKMGRRETVGVSSMSLEEKREYDRARKKLSRERKKAQEEANEREKEEEEEEEKLSQEEKDEGEEEELNQEEEEELSHDEVNLSGNEDVDFTRHPEATAVLNLIRNSPAKNRNFRYTSTKAEEILEKLEVGERVDVLIVLVTNLSEDIKNLLPIQGMDIITVPRSVKKTSFSGISSTKKYRYKDELLKVLNRATKQTADDLKNENEMVTKKGRTRPNRQTSSSKEESTCSQCNYVRIQ